MAALDRLSAHGIELEVLRGGAGHLVLLLHGMTPLVGIKVSDRETPDILDVFNTAPAIVRQRAWHDPLRWAPDYDAMSDGALVAHDVHAPERVHGRRPPRRPLLHQRHRQPARLHGRR